MNTLSPTNATAIAPRAWDTTAAKRRQAERLGSVEHIVTKIIAGIEKNIRHGCTSDNFAQIVSEWAGPRLAPFVKVATVSGQRAAKGKTLKLEIQFGAAAMELRPRLKQLQEALKSTGIERVTLG
jgi:hypothetical protein